MGTVLYEHENPRKHERTRQEPVHAFVGFILLFVSGGPGWIRTSEGVKPADLQSAPVGHFGTDPLVVNCISQPQQAPLYACCPTLSNRLPEHRWGRSDDTWFSLRKDIYTLGKLCAIILYKEASRFIESGFLLLDFGIGYKCNS